MSPGARKRLTNKDGRPHGSIATRRHLAKAVGEKNQKLSKRSWIVIALLFFFGAFLCLFAGTTFRPSFRSIYKSKDITTNASNTVHLEGNENLRKQKYQHRHVIPPIIYFTYKYNLLSPEPLAEGEGVDKEEKILAENTQNTINLHPNSKVYFLTDDECLTFIQRVMNMRHHTSSAQADETENTLAGLDEFFVQEKRGMIKSDVCRGAALYETGGLYFDVDIQARMNLWDVIPFDTEFVTPLVHKKHKVQGAFFQAFIGTIPRNSVIYRYLEMFVEYYRGSREVSSTKSIGVVLLRQAYDDVKSKTEASSFLQNVQLWQEVRYDGKFFPDVEPTVGRRRACHFLVAIPDRRRLVPFYSRVRGSRMCGGGES